MNTKPVAAAALASTITLMGACGTPAASSTDTDVSKALVMLDELPVAPEDTGYHYDRDDWPHWSSTGGGCDTRDTVLQEQGQSVKVFDGCAVTGVWVSVYDGETVHDAKDLDIDHVVPLAEAARSGVRDWSRVDRERYANDKRFLLAVTASSNRSKGDDDPARWLPSDSSYRCAYLAL